MIGIIVLLEKKGNQLNIKNKRGLTLLNCALKLLTKLYQLRLSLVLQDLITKQQSASLPGRSIHRSIILSNEILHKAMQSDLDFILMKLDPIKAFDIVG